MYHSVISNGFGDDDYNYSEANNIDVHKSQLQLNQNTATLRPNFISFPPHYPIFPLAPQKHDLNEEEQEADEEALARPSVCVDTDRGNTHVDAASGRSKKLTSPEVNVACHYHKSTLSYSNSIYGSKQSKLFYGAICCCLRNDELLYLQNLRDAF